MNNFFLGASLDEAQCVFVLPNKPILPLDHQGQESVAASVIQLIELNGNHWRKIFTIMAKLNSPSLEDWRQFRDDSLLKKVRLVFSTEQLNNYSGIVFIVGNTFREALPVNSQAKSLGEKQMAYVDSSYVWCPYLDYRQFPNLLIQLLREHLLEKLCLQH